MTGTYIAFGILAFAVFTLEYDVIKLKKKISTLEKEIEKNK